VARSWATSAGSASGWRARSGGCAPNAGRPSGAPRRAARRRAAPGREAPRRRPPPSARRRSAPRASAARPNDRRPGAARQSAAPSSAARPSGAPRSAVPRSGLAPSALRPSGPRTSAGRRSAPQRRRPPRRPGARQSAAPPSGPPPRSAAARPSGKPPSLARRSRAQRSAAPRRAPRRSAVPRSARRRRAAPPSGQRRPAAPARGERASAPPDPADPDATLAGARRGQVRATVPEDHLGTPDGGQDRARVDEGGGATGAVARGVRDAHAARSGAAGPPTATLATAASTAQSPRGRSVTPGADPDNAGWRWERQALVRPRSACRPPGGGAENFPPRRGTARRQGSRPCSERQNPNAGTHGLAPWKLAAPGAARFQRNGARLRERGSWPRRQEEVRSPERRLDRMMGLDRHRRTRVRTPPLTGRTGRSLLPWAHHAGTIVVAEDPESSIPVIRDGTRVRGTVRDIPPRRAPSEMALREPASPPRHRRSGRGRGRRGRPEQRGEQQQDDERADGRDQPDRLPVVRNHA